MTAAMTNNKQTGQAKLVEFKFVVQPVLLVVEDGKTVGEQALDPLPVYGLDALRDWCDRFPVELAAFNAERNG